MSRRKTKAGKAGIFNAEIGKPKLNIMTNSIINGIKSIFNSFLLISTFDR